MKEITKLMIDEYKLLELGFDFMGYTFNEEKSLSYHHLIVPRRKHGKYSKENGAILVRDTAHDYLHLIERIHRKSFEDITREIINENRQGYIDIKSIERIDEILSEFEDKYDQFVEKKGYFMIKDNYTRRLIKKRKIDS